MFRKRGYAATSMRDIAREMGMEAASLYNHISSKPALLQELLLGIAESFTLGMKEIKTSEAAGLQKLEMLIDLHVQLTVHETDAISLIPNEWIHLKEPFLKEFLILRDRYENDFKAIIEEAIGQGQLKKVDSEVTLFSILSTLRWLYSWYSKNQTNPEQLKKSLKQILIYGINA